MSVFFADNGTDRSAIDGAVSVTLLIADNLTFPCPLVTAVIEAHHAAHQTANVAPQQSPYRSSDIVRALSVGA